MALASNSPALGVGDPNANGTTSQNGVVRTSPNIDIGAYQSDVNPLIVTHTGDSGVGSLRYAIQWANSSAGLDTVLFNIPGSGVQTISLTSGVLPIITDPIIIDGYSQPGSSENSLSVGSNATLLIELDGSAVQGPSLAGLSLATSNSTIRGLIINRFTIGVNVASSGNQILGNYIGTNATGALALGNSVGIKVQSGASNNLIGGVNASARNVISGNNSHGIEITGIGTNNNVVVGTTLESMLQVQRECEMKTTESLLTVGLSTIELVPMVMV